MRASLSGKGKAPIPDLIFALNKQVRSCVIAFVSPDALYDKLTAKKLQYLGINPKLLNKDTGEILATFCHELCHVYENAYMHIPRDGYHDKQWEKLIEDCGLEAVYVNTSKTSVATKIKEGGIFEDFVKKFKDENGEDYFNIVEYSTEIEREVKVALGIDDESLSDGALKADNADKPIKKYNRNKIKYTCPDCGTKVWGKAGLHIACNDCACDFEEDEE